MVENDLERPLWERLLFTIQCDFDGTITVGDVGAAILKAFGPPELEELDAAYRAGRISVEEHDRACYRLIRAGPKALERFTSRSVEVRDGFLQFVDFCQKGGMHLVIVSCGLDMYVEPALKRLGLDGIERHTAKGCFRNGGIDIQYADPWGVSLAEGFKISYLRYLRLRGRPLVYIGDSISDVEPALAADHVLARGALEGYLRGRNLPHFSFDTFHDVIRHMKGLLGQPPPALQGHGRSEYEALKPAPGPAGTGEGI